MYVFTCTSIRPHFFQFIYIALVGVGILLLLSLFMIAMNVFKSVYSLIKYFLHTVYILWLFTITSGRDLRQNCNVFPIDHTNYALIFINDSYFILETIIEVSWRLSIMTTVLTLPVLVQLHRGQESLPRNLDQELTLHGLEPTPNNPPAKINNRVTNTFF